MANLFMRFPGGLGKALTLSYDDGVIQDIRLIEIMKKYGLKGTFNLNSGCWADRDYEDSATNHRRLTHERALKVYSESGFEVAVHGVTHPWLEQLPVNVCTQEVLQDRISLEKDFGTIVRGMAYPFGTFNDNVIASLKACGIVYSRTVWASENFDIPRDWLVLRPTCHHENSKLPELTKKFTGEKPGTSPWLFYLWGHSYEFDFHNNWEIIENFAEKVGGRSDIWYATNIEVYDYIQAYNSMISNAELTAFHNPSAVTLWFETEGKVYSVAPGETVSVK